jgi:hypothetical protein
MLRHRCFVTAIKLKGLVQSAEKIAYGAIVLVFAVSIASINDSIIVKTIFACL